MAKKVAAQAGTDIFRASEDRTPEDVVYAVEEASIERQSEILAKNKMLSTTLNQLREASIKEMHSALGSEDQDYSETREKMRLRSGEMKALFTPTPEGRSMRDEFRRRFLAEARGYASALEIDISKIDKIQKSFIIKAQSAVKEQFGVEDKMSYVTMSSAELPKRTDNPWSWRYPPYGNQWGTSWWSRSRGGSWVSHSENRVTGEIGCGSGISLHDASDSDFSWTNAQGEIWVRFQMPAAGMIEAWVYLQAIDTPYNGCLDDEWGVSDASIQQLSRAYIQVAAPSWGALRYQALVDYRRGEDEGCWSGRTADPGSYRYPHLFSTDSYAAGQWVTVAIGVHDYNYLWVNDMSCDANLTNRWFVRAIALRSTGAL
jgi:hypothetical protein